MKLPIRYYGDPILRVPCLKVEKITDEIKQLVHDMIETMDGAYNGVGLAANQVGFLHKIFVIRAEIQTAEGNFVLGPPEVYINPVLSNPSVRKEVMLEGCISFPHFHVEVERPLSIHVEALDINGKPFSEDVSGFKAREVMHENDHLNGKVLIDRLSKQRQREIAPALKELKSKYYQKK
jgi:peptide deformylase